MLNDKQESSNNVNSSTNRVGNMAGSASAPVARGLKNFNKYAKKKILQKKATGKMFKKKTKKDIKKAFEKLLSTLIKSLASSFIVFVFVIIIVFVSLICMIGPSNWLSKEGDIVVVQNNTLGIIADAYHSKEKDVYPFIDDYLNDKYNLGMSESDIEPIVVEQKLVGYNKKNVCDSCEKKECLEYRAYVCDLTHICTLQTVSEDTAGAVCAKSEISNCDIEACDNKEKNTTCVSSHTEDDLEKPIYKDIVDGANIDYENSSNITNIKIVFEPNPESVSNRINAYANAVNNVLSLFGVEAENESNIGEHDASEAVDYASLSEKEREEYINNVKEDVDANGNEYETQLNENYTKTIEERKDKIFYPETDSSKWTDEIEYEKNVVVGYHSKQVCDEYLPGSMQSTCLKSHSEEDKSNPILKDVATGTLTIPMNYDISFYKKEELEEIVPSAAEELETSEDETRSIIQEMIYQYYNSYYELYGLENEGDADFAGINPIFFEDGEEGWDGEFTYDDYVNKYRYAELANTGSYDTIWEHIHNLQGNQSTQCVAFVAGWLKDAYGLSGVGFDTGQNVVATLVNECGWTLLDTPAPGSVFSTSPYGTAGCSLNVAAGCNPYGHTGVILKVQNGMVTYMDGNYDDKGGMRIRTISVTSMLRNAFGGKYIKFAIPSK